MCKCVRCARCGTKFELIRAARREWMRKEVIADDGRSMPGDDKVVACGGEISTRRAPIYQSLPLPSRPPPAALPIITGCQPKSGIQVRSCRKIWLAFDQCRNSVTRYLRCTEVTLDNFKRGAQKLPEYDLPNISLKRESSVCFFFRKFRKTSYMLDIFQIYRLRK